MKARRGDLAAIVTTHATWVVGQPTQDRTDVQVGVVTSITRDGIVKRVRLAGWESELDVSKDHRRQVMVLEAARIDVPAAMRVAESHVWPGHTQVKPFDSVEECRAALRPCLVQS